MKLSVLSICMALAAFPSFAAAQAPAADPISQAVRDTWNGAKKNLTESAEQMPEADYAFKPVDTVRSFGAILTHVAGANYVFCAPARGEKAPYTEDHFEKTVKTKADTVKALNDSIAYCDAAYKALTDRTAAETITMPFSMGNAARASALMRNTIHLQEHYGNLVTYFRVKGMVPPTSRRQ
jgi:uncharacterized damage-inducible protein DinB